MRSKVLFFQATDFTKQDGGVRSSKNMLLCLSKITDVEFVVITCGPKELERTNAEFVNSLGLRHIFIDYRDAPSGTAKESSVAGRLVLLKRIIKEKYCFHMEVELSRRRLVESALTQIIRDQNPTLVVVNGITSALHVPAVFKSGVKSCFISHNNEVPYQRTIKQESVPIQAGLFNRIARALNNHGNWISDRRFRWCMDDIVRGCAGIVVLNAEEFPKGVPDKTVRAVIPPVLPVEDRQWSYHATRTILFVGGMLVKGFIHFSNRRAIQWICSSLAPELLRMDRSVMINIIGASRDEVPEEWRGENVTFMGRGTRDDVVNQLTTADLFLAPIDAVFGVKLKLSECISFGMPFIATDAALNGLPHIGCVPKLTLEDPAASASLIVTYLNNPNQLIRLSESILNHASHASKLQDRSWRDLLDRIIGNAGVQT